MENQKSFSGQWINWFGALAAAYLVAILCLDWESWAGPAFFADHFRYERIKGYTLSIIFGLAPAFIAFFLALAGGFWATFTIGLWVLSVALILCVVGHTTSAGSYLLLPAIALIALPFVRMVFHHKSSRIAIKGPEINWLGSLAAIGLVIGLTISWGQWVDRFGLGVSFWCGLVPAFISVFAAITGRFLLTSIIGSWFLVLGLFALTPPLAALTLIATPFLRMTFPKAVPEPTTKTMKMSGADVEKTCPFCAERIKAAAILCRYCGKPLPPTSI